ncbi:hypothetical protein SAM19_01426 [Brevibacillus laterosporus]|nr:hypothetical protein [Brevibacillus laterosporus]
MDFYTWIQQEMPQLIISTYREVGTIIALL